MKQFFSTLALLFVLSFGFIAPANAQLKSGIFDRYFTTTFGETYDTSTTGSDIEANLPAAVGRVINTVLGLVGVVMLVIVVWAGFLWLTARGDSGQVEKAQSYIKNAVIGMAIVLGAFIITSFVVTQLERAAGTAGQSSSSGRNTGSTIVRPGAGSGSSSTGSGQSTEPIQAEADDNFDFDSI